MATPKVSVIVATFCSGDGLRRVISSLDTQTLPQDDFETIFVDDGSPDATFAQLQELAATRPNMTVCRIENSGWPSRPRNIGIDHSHGEYVFFMDHDDSLYPDGLHRAYEYARETDADILGPKESKTNDSWWGMSSLTQGNVPNAIGHGGLKLLLPLVPHKLYRRALLDEHNIRFPEGAAMLWEDQYINVQAYSVAERVAILADSPAYLWHASATNTSHTFDPGKPAYWAKLEELLTFAVSHLSTPVLRGDRDDFLAHHIRHRVIDRLTQQLFVGAPDDNAQVLRLARHIQSHFLSDSVFARLSKKHQTQAMLLRLGAAKLMRAHHQADVTGAAATNVTDVRWEGRALQLRLVVDWRPKDPAVPVLRRTTLGRLLRALPVELQEAIPEHLQDVTDDAGLLSVAIVLRGRSSHVSWAVTVDPSRHEFIEDGDTLIVRLAATSTINVSVGGLGARLNCDVWDLRSRTEWVGMVRKGSATTTTPALPALIDGQPYVVYTNAKGALAIDPTQRMRCLATDAKPRLGAIGSSDALMIELTALHVVGDAVLNDPRLALVADDGPDSRSRPADVLELHDPSALWIVGRIVADSRGNRVEGSVSALPAKDGTRYAVYCNREDMWRRSAYFVLLNEEGDLTLHHLDDSAAAPRDAEAYDLSPPPGVPAESIRD